VAQVSQEIVYSYLKLIMVTGVICATRFYEIVQKVPPHVYGLAIEHT